jgi:UrcA family protein
MKMNAISKILAALALTASVAGAAYAQPSIAVSARDLDLSTAQGQKSLATRIHNAAVALCASEGISQSPEMIRAERRCIAATKRSVEREVAARSGVRTAAD